MTFPTYPAKRGRLDHGQADAAKGVELDLPRPSVNLVDLPLLVVLGKPRDLG